MLELSHPWFLTLLPLPILIWMLVARVQQNIVTAINVPFYAKLTMLPIKNSAIYSNVRSILALWFAWGLLVIAFAQPQWIGAPIPLSRDGRNIMLALDLSSSMGLTDRILNDRPISRLEIVKLAAKKFVVRRFGDNIGLILFGDNAYLQTPLTYDYANIALRIDESDVGLAGKTTALGDAIGLAVKHLQTTPQAGRVIILLTDGANNSGVLNPEQASELARAEHIKIYAIGLGAEPDPRISLNPVFALNGFAELDEESLKKISAMTNGRYFRATDPNSLQTIYATIDRLEKTRHATVVVRPQQEYYPWLVGAALLILMQLLVLKERK